jgi:hypothetical protein
MYNPKCDCCKIVSGNDKGNQFHEIIIPLEGGWVLNHCGAKTGRNILGRLVLASRQHRAQFSDLTTKEVITFGTNMLIG